MTLNPFQSVHILNSLVEIHRSRCQSYNNIPWSNLISLELHTFCTCTSYCCSVLTLRRCSCCFELVVLHDVYPRAPGAKTSPFGVCAITNRRAESGSWNEVVALSYKSIICCLGLVSLPLDTPNLTTLRPQRASGIAAPRRETVGIHTRHSASTTT